MNNVWRMLRKSRPLWVTVRNAVLFNAIWMGFGFFHRVVVSRAIWRTILTLSRLTNLVVCCAPRFKDVHRKTSKSTRE